MNVNLKNYQEKAIKDLIVNFKSFLLEKEHKKLCIFQAPTGSGKTLIVAKFIEELIKELSQIDLCFVWVSVGKGDLHLQSKNTLVQIFGGTPRVSLVEEEFIGAREWIIRNEVVVINWEKLWSKNNKTNEWKNILMKNGEKLNFRDILAKTREQRKIILIIDESHIGKGAKRMNEVRDEINADAILEMSATPKKEFSAVDIARGNVKYVLVEPKNVIDEGMIKKELIINENIGEITENELDSQEIVLQAAYEKQLELKKLFKIENSFINPLVLIQIPPSEAGKEKIKFIKKFLMDKNISEKKGGKGNGKLAIWLSEQKSETLNWISEPYNEIEFLIFKQAINTGWDCPRAHILIKFRKFSNSETFEIQTVGRILRMPEQNHYDNENLNRGYIFTNVQNINVKNEEYNLNIIKHLKSTRRNIYKPITLTSYYKSRADYGDITSSFISVFEKEACKYFDFKYNRGFSNKNLNKVENKGVSLNIEKYQQQIIADTKIEGKTFDEIEGKINPSAYANLIIIGSDLENRFEEIIKNNLDSFKNIKRSVPIVKTAVYSWFRKYLDSKSWKEEIILVQKIFVIDNHRKKFEKILTNAIKKYKAVREKEVLNRIQNSERDYDFEIEREKFFNQNTDENVNHKKYIYEPCYLSISRSNPEKEFEKFLDENDDKILWWWKNGDKNKEHFGIKYKYAKNEIHTFYPDYIVHLIDGRIEILEVKSKNDYDGETYTTAKAERLQEYIKEQKNPKLFGGIVIQHSWSWKINKKQIYSWKKWLKKDLSDWEDLIF